MIRFTLFALVFFMTTPAFAHPIGRGAPYTVDVQNDSGQHLRTFEHQGQTFVLGENGERYNIHVRNQTNERVEVVVTVDGRDVISGRMGDYVHERGYVLGPYGDVVIEGFRTSEQSVAAFRFSNPEDSYSSRMGTPENVGIIGVAVFREREPEVIVRNPRPRPYESEDRALGRRGPSKSGASSSSDRYRSEAPAAAPSSSGSGYAAGESKRSYSADEMSEDGPSNLGTEYGEAQYSRVRNTHFVREHATRPSQVITLRYDDEQGLLARGIRVHPVVRPAYASPSAFPRNRFAPPPP